MSAHPLVVGSLVNPTTALKLFRTNTIDLMARDLGTVQSWSARGRFSKAVNSNSIVHFSDENSISVPFTYTTNQFLVDGVASSRYSTLIALFGGNDIITGSIYAPLRMRFENMTITHTSGSKTFATPYYYSYTAQGDAASSVGVYHVERPINTITGATVNVNRIVDPVSDSNDNMWVHSALVPGRWRLRQTVTNRAGVGAGNGGIPIYTSGNITIETVEYQDFNVTLPPAGFVIYTNYTNLLDASVTLLLYDSMLGSTFTYQHCIFQPGVEAVFERNIAAGNVNSNIGSGRIFGAVNTTADTKDITIRMPSIIRRTVSGTPTNYTVPQTGAAFVFEPLPLFNINPEPTGPLYSPRPSGSSIWEEVNVSANSVDGAYLTFTQHGLVYSGSSRQRNDNPYTNNTVQNIDWSHPSWYQFGPVTNIGASYWIRATIVSQLGNGVTSGTFNTWLPLTSEVRWGYNNPVTFVNPMVRNLTLNIQLATDSSGSNIVATWSNVTLQVQDQRGI